MLRPATNPGDHEIGDSEIRGEAQPLLDHVLSTRNPWWVEASDIVRYLGHFDYVSGSGTPTRQLNFVAVVLAFQDIVHPEHSAAAWVGAAMLDDYVVTDESRRVIQGYFDTRG